MKKTVLFPLALCTMLGACASIPPSEPHRVTAIAGDKVSDQKFAHDDASCKDRAKSVTDAEAAAGQWDVQRHFDQIYADCMLAKGYDIEQVRRRVAYYGPGPYGPYGPGPYGPGAFYGPGWGPGFYYGWGGRRW